MHPEEDIANELSKRKESYSTSLTNLLINPMVDGFRQSEKYDLFFVPIPELEMLNNQIRDNSQKIMKLVGSLPAVASQHFFLGMLIEEIKSTNDIEDVKSTTTEIKTAISEANGKSKKKTRLKSFARMYLEIQQQNIHSIKKLEDLRKLYDFLLDGEIALADLPDGKYFRKNNVRIGSATATVHQPKIHEEDFLEDILDWINFINRQDIDPLYKAAIAHYYLEYIHPFYDGNGRLGRYIFCSYVGKKVDPYTAVSFSYQINEHKKKYYDAFQEVSQPRNYGEITFFVHALLEYLLKGQADVLLKLKASKRNLDYLKDKLNESVFKAPEKNILFYLAQAKLFGDLEPGIEERVLEDLMNQPELKVAKTKTRRIVNDLAARGFVKTTKKKPIVRELTQQFFQEIGVEL